MLADSVEASVRSLSNHDEPAIRAMVGGSSASGMDDGQFDECDLTLRDLDRIREAFVAQLSGMYHRRIEYPQNKIVELESRRGSRRRRLTGGARRRRPLSAALADRPDVRPGRPGRSVADAALAADGGCGARGAAGAPSPASSG